jgi:hypothetical protein
MPRGCPQCVIALEELVQEIRKMTTRKYLAPNIASKMEHELQDAIAESKKAEPDSRLIVGKLNGAKTLIEGVASTCGLLNNFAETTATVKRYLS